MNYLSQKNQIKSITEKTFIADSGVTSHMVHPEYNMTNLKDSETRVSVGDSRTETGENVDIGTAIRGVTEKYHVTLSNMSVIPGLHAELFRVTW